MLSLTAGIRSTGGQVYYPVPGARLPVVGALALADPGRQGEREVLGQGLDIRLVHMAQLGEPLLEVGAAFERQAADREPLAQPRQLRRWQPLAEIGRASCRERV